MTVTEFSWHKGAVTSIEWCPSEGSVFASSGADEQVCLWDLSTEADDEEQPHTSADLKDIPNQLLFIHQVLQFRDYLISGPKGCERVEMA